MPGVTIRGMAGDQETVTAAAAVRAGGELLPRASARPLGPVAIAAELLARTRAELSMAMRKSPCVARSGSPLVAS